MHKNTTAQTIVEGTVTVFAGRFEAGCNSSIPVRPLQDLP